MTDERRDDAHLVPAGLTDEEEMAYQAYQLTLRGMDWVSIANEVGYANAKSAEVNVRRYLQVAALELTKEHRAEVLQLQADRINKLINAKWDMAMVGDDKAADFCLKAIATLSKLFGLEQLHEKDENQTSQTIVVTNADYTETLKKITGDES